jgi:hypothetical protein
MSVCALLCNARVWEEGQFRENKHKGSNHWAQEEFCKDKSESFWQKCALKSVTGENLFLFDLS